MHPQEALLQQARALQQSEAFAEYRQRRVVVEHRLARLVQLGIRQSRYFGRAKTRFQLYLAAIVANLTLVATKAGLTGETGSGPSDGSAQVAGMVNSATAWLGQIWTLSLLVSALLTKSLFPRGGLRPSFWDGPYDGLISEVVLTGRARIARKAVQITIIDRVGQEMRAPPSPVGKKSAAKLPAPHTVLYHTPRGTPH